MTITDHPQANVAAIPNPRVPAGSDPHIDPSAGDNQTAPVDVGPASPPAHVRPTPRTRAPVVDPLLFINATTHGDLEQQRIASENRLRILTTTEPDDDGIMRGFGLSTAHPDVARLATLTEGLKDLEHQAALTLKHALRRCAINPWVKGQIGLGEQQAARLLGAIGDPYWHMGEDRPRTVSELWAYSGLHVLATPTNLDTDLGTHPPPVGVAARRRKGHAANWSGEAKMRAYLCAVSCIKQTRSPYRVVYDNRRAHTATTHPDWTPGHSHSDGLRITSKAILRDLWREAKRLHEDTA